MDSLVKCGLRVQRTAKMRKIYAHGGVLVHDRFLKKKFYARSMFVLCYCLYVFVKLLASLLTIVAR